MAVTPSFLLKPGTNFIQPLANQARWQFGNSNVSKILSETGRFTENDYEYCFEFTGTETKPGADDMYLKIVIPTTFNLLSSYACIPG